MNHTYPIKVPCGAYTGHMVSHKSHRRTNKNALSIKRAVASFTSLLHSSSTDFISSSLAPVASRIVSIIFLVGTFGRPPAAGLVGAMASIISFEYTTILGKTVKIEKAKVCSAYNVLNKFTLWICSSPHGRCGQLELYVFTGVVEYYLMIEVTCTFLARYVLYFPERQ